MMRLLPLLLMFFSSALANPQVSYLFEKQRVDLEKHLESKIQMNLEPILPKSAYIINVGVRLKPLPKVSRVRRRAQRPVRPIENPSPAELNDLIPLPKVGYWPIKETVEEEPQEVVGLDVSFDEMVDSILIDIRVDEEKVTPEQKQSVEEVTNLIARKSTPVDPFVVVKPMKVAFENQVAKDFVQSASEKLQAEFDKKAENLIRQAEENKSSKSLLLDLAGPIALVVVMILMAMVASFLGRNFLSLQEKRLDLDETISRRQMEVSMQDRLDRSQTGEVSRDGESNALVEATEMGAFIGGLEQVKNLAETEPEAVAFQIKKWLRSKDERAPEALYAVSRSLPIRYLSNVRQALSDSERKVWNSIIHKHPMRHPIHVIDNYVADSLSGEAVFPISVADVDVKEMIQSINSEEAALCIERNGRLAKLFMHYLPSLTIAKIVKRLDANSVKGLAMNSSEPSHDEIQSLGRSLKETLTAIRQERSGSETVFLEMAPDLLLEVGYLKEASVFESIGMLAGKDKLIEIAREFLPSQLVQYVPKDILTAVLNKRSLVQRAELLYSAQDESRVLLQKVIGGGRAQEVLQAELDEIQADANKASLISRSSQKYWQSFLDDIRAELRRSPEVVDEILPQIESWAGQVASSGGPSAAA
ncbi:MAG: hypothetical protein HRT45_03485 [Bdellovibrionales bacterium]|nr:hypothetical protein [Bdellovibrionales bacterium]